MNTIIGKMLKFILIVLAVIFVLAMFLVAKEKMEGTGKEEPKNDVKIESAKVKEKEVEGTPYVILKDKTSDDIRQITVEYSEFDSNKYLEEKQHLKEKYDNPEMAAYYFYPFALIVEMLKEDVATHKETKFFSVVIKQKGEKPELMTVTIDKEKYLKDGLPFVDKDLQKLNEASFWLSYKSKSKSGIEMLMHPTVREFYNELFGY